jgi:hypothetical protein
MDLNSVTNKNSIKLTKNFLVIKFPANIQNPGIAIESLGGKDNIFAKVTI